MSRVIRVSFLGLVVSVRVLGSVAKPASYVIDKDVSIYTSTARLSVR